ncbi:MAG: hypothetical protein HC904_04395 [Blastochloris sp.]|nr:hypothetical protein [Blastochloris sp.]
MMALLLVVTLIAGLLSYFHPQRETLLQLSTIHITDSLVSVDDSPVLPLVLSSSRESQLNGVSVPISLSELEPSLDQIWERYTGREHILIHAEPSQRGEGWLLAKRLRRLGFPKVSLSLSENTTP